MRDTRKPASYFQEYLEDVQAELEEYLEDIESNENTERQRKRLVDTLFGICSSHLDARYSSGTGEEDLKSAMDVLLSLHKNYDYSLEGRYVQALNVLSAAISLNYGTEELSGFIQSVERHGLNDRLMSHLMNGLDTDYPIVQGFLFDNPYKHLEPLLDSPEDAKPEMLVVYLGRWYEGHRDTSWHGSHRSKELIYSGYWAYEAAALAKIHGIDDEGLKDVEYYPYDLLHFQE